MVLPVVAGVNGFYAVIVWVLLCNNVIVRKLLINDYSKKTEPLWSPQNVSSVSYSQINVYIS